jgi:RNA polymerase sigma factor (sigma-70 family)
MTNEELVERIQRGEADLVPRLWEQVRGLVCQYAFRFFRQRRKRCDAFGVTVDDLIQESYFAFCYAVQAYNPYKGFRFTNYLNFPLKTCFKKATGGIRDNKFESRNPCASLDAQIDKYGDNDATLVDTVRDENAEAPFEAVEDAVVNSQLREVLNGILSALPENERDVLKRHYYRGQTLWQIAEQTGDDPKHVRQLGLRGLQKLRSPANMERLMSVQDVIDTTYKAGGLQRFRNTGYSSVELAFERIEAMRAAGRIEPE